MNIKNNNFNKKVLRAGIWYVISVILVRGVSFFTTPLFTRLMTKEQYGILTVYDSWLRILFPVLTLSLYASVERAKYEFEEEYDAYISSIQLVMTGLCFGAAVITVFFRGHIEKVLNMSDMMLIVMFLYVWAQAAINSIQRREKLLLRYWQNIIITTFATLIPTVLSIGILCWYKKAGYREELLSVRILSFYLPQIMIGFVLAMLIFWRGHIKHFKTHIRFAVVFSLPLIPHVLSMEILSQSDKIMVGRLAGDEKAGIYSLGVTVMWIILLVSQAVGDAWLPWMYEKLKCQEYQSIKKVWRRMIELFSIFSWLVVVFAPEIIWIFGGRSYEESVYLVAPLTVGGMAHFFCYSYISVEQYYKKTVYVMVVSVAAVLLNLLLNYVGIIKLGYMVAAFTTAFCYTFMMIIHAVLLKLKFGNTFMPAKVTIAVFLFFSAADFLTVVSYQLSFWCRCMLAVLGIMMYVGVYYHRIKEWMEKWQEEQG